MAKSAEYIKLYNEILNMKGSEIVELAFEHGIELDYYADWSASEVAFQICDIVHPEIQLGASQDVMSADVSAVIERSILNGNYNRLAWE